jgi:hypothetical protein
LLLKRLLLENARLYQQARQERDHIIKAQEDAAELARKPHDGPVRCCRLCMNPDHPNDPTKSSPKPFIMKSMPAQSGSARDVGCPNCS